MSSEENKHGKNPSLPGRKRAGEKRYWIGVDGTGTVHIRSFDSTEFVSMSRRQFIATIQAVAYADTHVAEFIGTATRVEATLIESSSGAAFEIPPDPETRGESK